MIIGMGLWIVVLAVVVWALVSLTHAQPVRVAESALEILKRRYARGEISQAEFEQARRDLV